jgi:hypothetical protein
MRPLNRREHRIYSFFPRKKVERYLSQIRLQSAPITSAAKSGAMRSQSFENDSTHAIY